VIIKEEARRAWTYVLIGDGPSDVRVIKAVAEGYDHGKVVKLPQRALFAEKGLSVLRALAALVDKVDVNRYLVVVDREHVGSLQDVEMRLTEHGFEVVGCWSLG